MLFIWMKVNLGNGCEHVCEMITQKHSNLHRFYWCAVNSWKNSGLIKLKLFSFNLI